MEVVVGRGWHVAVREKWKKEKWEKERVMKKEGF